MSAVESVTFSEWKEKVVDSKLPVLVDYFSGWSDSELCKKQETIVEEAAAQLAGRVRVLRLSWNADAGQPCQHIDPEVLKGLAGSVKIFTVPHDADLVKASQQHMAPPVLALFIDGKLVRTMFGFHSAQQITEFVDNTI